jgi:hypothetical protein
MNSTVDGIGTDFSRESSKTESPICLKLQPFVNITSLRDLQEQKQNAPMTLTEFGMISFDEH